MEGWDDKMGEKNHDPTTILTIHHAPIPSMAMFNSFLLVYQAGDPKS
jgi:hypothetical protein